VHSRKHHAALVWRGPTGRLRLPVGVGFGHAHHCLYYRGKLKLRSYYSIVVQISILAETMVRLRCMWRRTLDKSGLLKCYLNAGQELMHTNDQDPEGETPLHWAVHGQHHQTIRLLLEHGADVNVRRNSGETPSQLASSLSLHEIAELLSEYGTESVKK
jgi:ankyrin repeat protein